MHASTQLLPLKGGKPALDAMEPRGVRRREVRMKARVPGEPSAEQRGLVRPVVVHDDVHVPVGRHLDIEGGQEGATRDRAMPPTNLTPRVSRLHCQGGKERRRPVPFVVVGPPFSLAPGAGGATAPCDPRPVCGVSSTQKTAACGGGLRYNPTLSRTLSMSNGSGDSLKGFVRCGCGPGGCSQPVRRPAKAVVGCERQKSESSNACRTATAAVRVRFSNSAAA